MDDVQSKLIAKIVEPNIPVDLLIKAFKIITNENSMETENTKFLSDTDACVYAGRIVHSTLWRWRQRGLPSYEVGGRRLYRITDLDKFIIQANRSN